MGAFFLYKNDDKNINLDAVKRVFRKKGFTKPKVFNLGVMTLWLYRKQLIDEDNYVFAPNGAELFVTGSVVYKGLSYRQSIQEILIDYSNGNLNFDSLLGSFCLIFNHNEKIEIFTDRLCTHHVFFDEGLGRISSSFLAMIASSSKPCHLNRLAFYEKITTGYNIGPDTLFDEIKQLTPTLKERLGNDTIRFIPHPATSDTLILSKKQGFQTCVQTQLQALVSYFNHIKPLAIEYGCDLGLSSGYDSRLILALAKKVGLPASVHSHYTMTVHEAEVETAEKIAKSADVPFRKNQTRRIEDHSEASLYEIMEDGLYYYDGRTGDNSGAFSETYTRTYKLKTLGKERLRLNGEGGEIYRNYYHTASPMVYFRDWFINHLFYWYAQETLRSKNLMQSVEDYIFSKVSNLLEIPHHGWVNQLFLRRYYGEIHLPYCEGFLANADNQLAFFLFPFMEMANLYPAYQATPYIGFAGKFEATMIECLNPKIASFSSHYGFPLNQPPVNHLLYCAAKGYIPDRFWYLRKRWQNRKNRLNTAAYKRYERLHRTSSVIREIELLLSDVFPELDIQAAFCNIPQQSTLLYVGYALLCFKDKIQF